MISFLYNKKTLKLVSFKVFEIAFVRIHDGDASVTPCTISKRLFCGKTLHELL